MRNLKKFLALVLALVMAMSLMLTANAAITKNATDVYPDTVEGQYAKEFQTAIDVLTGMNIFHGENGDFKPTAPILRSEAAAIMYRLVTGDVSDSQAQLYAPLASEYFTDVPYNMWYAGYVGYCVDAGFINGYNGEFMPNSYVTGYEMLKMLLKAVGYGQNGEFVGANWRINVGYLAQQLGVLNNIQSTHYANTLSQNSAREVVAELAFQVAAYVNTVRYEYGYYNKYDGVPIADKTVENTLNPTLGAKVFGLSWTSGVVIGNQDTGESNTRLGRAGSNWSAYTWYDYYDLDSDPSTREAERGSNISFGDLVTGIGQLGHNITVWYGWTGTYAWYDNVKHVATVQVEDSTTLDIDPTANSGDSLGAYAAGAGFSVSSSSSAVFNDFFGKSGKDASGNTGLGNAVFTGYEKSPVNLYLLISNSSNKSLDLVIPLNIEGSQITQSNAVRGVETVSVPVTNAGDGSTAPKFISTNNVQTVNSVDTGIIAKAALTKTANESTSTLGDYELGFHINGTSPRNVSTTETTAILGKGDETAYFLLYKVQPKAPGTVVYYNAKDGIVMLDDGTTLERSTYYDTVVCTNPLLVSPTVMPEYAIPQSVSYDSIQGKYVESYNYAEYTFYLDFEGKYLGAERGYTNEFFYGTYLDYAQPTSSSTFTYYLTGVTLNGEVETRVVEKAYDWNNIQSGRTTVNTIRSTDILGVPYRDTYSSSGQVNGLNTAEGYKGYTVSGTTLDPNLTADVINQTDYPMNMARLGVIRAADADSNFGDVSTGAMINDITIGNAQLTLGLADVSGGLNTLFLNNSTKIILVSGYGEDSLVPEVYNGINDLVSQNNAAGAVIHLNPNAVDSNGKYIGRWNHDSSSSTPYAAMTYFMKSPNVFAQSGAVADQIDVIILPKAAVEFTASAGSTGLYFMGDPSYTLISSHDGSPIYQYTVYDLEGYQQQVWLKDDPSVVAAYHDTFVQLTADSNTSVYGATVYNSVWLINGEGDWAASGTNAGYLKYKIIDGANPADLVTYQSVAYNSLSGKFTWQTAGQTELLNVASAHVTNLNAENSPSIGGGTGYVWPGIVDITTLNQAASINPVTGTPVRVAAVVNGLTVTQIFVCWDQN